MSTPRVMIQSVKRANVAHDTFIEQSSGTKFVVNNKITIKYPGKVVEWKKQLDNCETLLFKAENDSSLNVNLQSLKGRIYKYRKYLTVEGAYQDDLARNNYNSKASNKARGVLEKLSKMWEFDIDYEADKDDIIEEIISAVVVKLGKGRAAQRKRELAQQKAFVDFESRFCDDPVDDDDSTYVPSVQSDDSEDNRNNVRQMARQRYDYESDDDDSTYIGSDSSVSSVEDIEEYYTRDYEFA